MVLTFSKDQVKQYFKDFDNGNGLLSLAEVDRAITKFHPELGTNRQAILRSFKAADTNGSGFLELREFERFLQLVQQYNEFSRIFQQLDSNGDRRISFPEFKKGHKLINDSRMNAQELKQAFDRIDTNHGGYILFDEFCIYMAKKNVL